MKDCQERKSGLRHGMRQSGLFLYLGNEQSENKIWKSYFVQAIACLNSTLAIALGSLVKYHGQDTSMIMASMAKSNLKITLCSSKV